MRTPSISLLSFAALAASLADGAAIPQGTSSDSMSGSASASRRSSIQSTSSTISPSTAPSSSSSTPTSSSFSSSSTANVRPVFKTTDLFSSSTSSSAFSSSSPTSSRRSSLATSSSYPPSSSTYTSSSSSSSSSSSQPAAMVTPQAIVAAANGRPIATTAAPKTSSTSSTVAKGRPVATTAAAKLSSSSLSSTSMIRSSSSSSSSAVNTPSPLRSSSISITQTNQPSISSSTPIRSSTLSSSSALASSSSTPTKSASSSSQLSSSVTPASSSSSRSSSKLSSSAAVFTPAASASSSGLSSARASSTVVPQGAVVGAAAQTLSSSSSSAASSTITRSPLTTTVSSLTQKSSSSTLASSTTSAAARPNVATTTAKPSSTSSTASPSASASVSASYIDLGCWYDSGSNRTLAGASYSGSSMTKETCASFCTSHNMPYSGTEYGDECYCSATAPTAAAATWCNMPCAGNSTEICGSGNALSILYANTATTALSSTSLGCYGDSTSSRTMTGPSFSSSSMTNEACSSFCTAQSYEYSGTEYGDQCYCSHTAPWSAPVGCSMPCAGNAGEVCGDGDALSVLHTPTTTGTSSSTTSAAASATPTKLNTSIDLNQKFSSWSTWKARGVNIGNWLVLEQWMDTAWFNGEAPGAVDEWTFCQTLEANCPAVLQEHWQTFITESDIADMSSMEINTLRIPVGFWAFIDPLSSEPYVRSTQLVELQRVLGYAASYGMTVILDIHGLPGSQNGKDHSGHQGSIEWYTADNQARSLQAVQAAATWAANSGYAGSTLSAIEVCNEPSIADWSTWLQYKDYVLQSYAIIQSTVPSVATMFHDGFWALEPWNEFFSAGDNAVIDTHKYWAFSPTTLDQAESDVCAYVDTFAGLNLPVFVGEFSLSVDADVSSYVGYAVGFFESQMAVWLQAAGAAFWSLKVFNSDGTTQNGAWSAQEILQSGVFSNIDVWSFSESVC